MSRRILTKASTPLATAANPATVAMMEVFGGDQKAYNYAQYNAGLDYLAANYSAFMADHLATSNRFWTWWRLVWAGRDEVWERYCRGQGLCMPSLIEASYHQFHTLHLPYYDGFLSLSPRPTHRRTER